MARYMEIPGTLPYVAYMEISMYLFNGIAKKHMDISLYQSIRAAQRNMEMYT